MTTRDRVYPEHFKANGEPKRKYPTLTDAIYHTLTQTSGDPDRPFRAYPCFCQAFHIGRRYKNAPPVVEDPETIRWALTTMGWAQGEDHVYSNGDVREKWVHPGVGETGLAEAWHQAQLTARRTAEAEAARRSLAWAGSPGSDMRVRLLAAGWTRVDNPDVERWLPPGVTGKRKKGRKMTVEQAFRCLLRERTTS